MKKLETKRKVSPKKTSVKPESIQDKDLIRNWDRVYLKALKNWSWNLAWKEKYAGKFLVIYLIIVWICAVMWVVDFWLSYFLWFNLWDWKSLNLFGNFADLVLGIWLLWFSLNIANWLYQKVDNFFDEITWRRIWKLFLWTLIMYLVITVCLLLLSAFGSLWKVAFWITFWILIIISILFVVRFKFFVYAIIDKWYWPIAALQYSWNITKWHFWEIIWVDLYILLINILWLLCLVVGLIWTSAMTNIILAKYYRLLSNMYDESLVKVEKIEKVEKAKKTEKVENVKKTKKVKKSKK